MVDPWWMVDPGSLAKFLALTAQPRKLLATDLPHRLEALRGALQGIAVADTRRVNGGGSVEARNTAMKWDSSLGEMSKIWKLDNFWWLYGIEHVCYRRSVDL